MSAIAEVFRTAGAAYCAAGGEAVPARHRAVINSITHCRTEALGTLRCSCDECGRLFDIYRSCGLPPAVSRSLHAVLPGVLPGLLDGSLPARRRVHVLPRRQTRGVRQPHTPLARLSKARFFALIQDSGLLEELPSGAFEKDWNVDDDSVTFAYTDTRTGVEKRMCFQRAS